MILSYHKQKYSACVNQAVYIQLFIFVWIRKKNKSSNGTVTAIYENKTDANDFSLDVHTFRNWIRSVTVREYIFKSFFLNI